MPSWASGRPWRWRRDPERCTASGEFSGGALAGRSWNLARFLAGAGLVTGLPPHRKWAITDGTFIKIARVRDHDRRRVCPLRAWRDRSLGRLLRCDEHSGHTCLIPADLRERDRHPETSAAKGGQPPQSVPGSRAARQADKKLTEESAFRVMDRTHRGPSALPTGSPIRQAARSHLGCAGSSRRGRHRSRICRNSAGGRSTYLKLSRRDRPDRHPAGSTPRSQTTCRSARSARDQFSVADQLAMAGIEYPNR
jgi:hypothetical protein